MIWFLLLVVATIAAIVFGFIEGWGVGEKIFFSVACGIGAFLVGGLIFLGANIVCFQPVEKAELTEVKEIYALADNSYLSGHGNFIYVKVSEEDKYSYMVVNEDGSYSKETIQSTDVRIKEVDGVTPILETYTYESKNEFWSVYSEDYYYFVVPKGTVTHDFSVDLE